MSDVSADPTMAAIQKANEILTDMFLAVFDLGDNNLENLQADARLLLKFAKMEGNRLYWHTPTSSWQATKKKILEDHPALSGAPSWDWLARNMEAPPDRVGTQPNKYGPWPFIRAIEEDDSKYFMFIHVRPERDDLKLIADIQQIVFTDVLIQNDQFVRVTPFCKFVWAPSGKYTLHQIQKPEHLWPPQ
jgi:hypothetical protein